MHRRILIPLVLRPLVTALVLAVAMTATVAAQSVAVRYDRLTQREKTVRAAATLSIAAARTLAKSYESFTRAHPVSGYADNALWQGAGLYETVYARSKDRRDRDQATRLLTWLKKEYPTGTLAKQADARLKSVTTTAAEPAAAPPSPARVEPAPALPATTAKPIPPPLAASAPSSGETPKLDVAAPPIASVPLAPAAAPAAPMPAIAVKEIAYTSLPKGDRLILEFTAETPYSSSRSANPDRVFIDLPSAGALPVVAERAGKITGTLVKTLTVVRAANGSIRLVLQLAGQPRYSTFPLYDPFRLVIDVESDLAGAMSVPRYAPPAVVAKSVARDSIGFASAAAAPASVTAGPAVRSSPMPPATRTGDYSLARQLGLGVSRIVIDPGHGGHDPGASANGITEASLVLDVALRLEAILSAREGTDVVLTRRTDAYVPLEERTAIANRETADMFISIHANASPQKATSGVETFFLDFASNPHAQSVAARENATSSQNMRVLPELVKTIALTNKLQESRELAGAVQTSLVKRLRGQDKGAKDLGVKRAPFVVLIGAQMPSVLAEVSFLTNKSEATLLKQGAYRQRIAQALADAIVKYQGTLKVTTVTARNDGDAVNSR